MLWTVSYYYFIDTNEICLCWIAASRKGGLATRRGAHVTGVLANHMAPATLGRNLTSLDISRTMWHAVAMEHVFECHKCWCYLTVQEYGQSQTNHSVHYICHLLRNSKKQQYTDHGLEIMKSCI